MDIKVRDLRKRDQYKIDDAYLNGYAKICGIFATAVYNSLSRHADFHTQECYPSLELIADQHGISKPTVLKSLRVLEIAKIIIKKRVGKMQPNEYTLADKSEWLPKEELAVLVNTKNKRGMARKRGKTGKFGSEVNDMEITSEVNVTTKCSKSYGESEVNDMDCKDNTLKDNTVKVTGALRAAGGERFDSALIIKVIDDFKDNGVNMAVKSLYARKDQRAACQRLVEMHGLEKVLKVIAILPKTNRIAYLPTITTPIQLEEKWSALEANLIKEKAKAGHITRQTPNYVL
jgi:hypothetical protein